MKKWLIAILIVFLLSGCVESNKNTLIVHPTPEIVNKQQDKKIEYSDFELPSTVAIVPFKSKNKEISKIVTKTFYNFFSPLPYRDIEPDYVNKVLKNKEISYDSNTKTIEEIAKKLGADGIIYGDVQNFGKLFLGVYSEVSVGARIKFYSLKEHKVIWKYSDTAKKRSGGFSLSPWGLAATIALSAYNLRKIQIYRAAEDLFRDIPKIIPHPLTSTIKSIPLPSLIIHSGMQKDIFGIGDKFIVSLTAKPNLKIYVDIPGVKTTLPLKEKKPGHYETSYIIQPHDNGEGYLHFIMEKKGGVRRSFYDVIAPITIDTTKPKSPNLLVQYGNYIKIVAQDRYGDEISEYILEVLKDGKYQELKRSKSGIFKLKPLNKTFFVRARSIDRANNISNPSKPIKLFLYNDSNVAKSSLFKNETIINNIVRIDNNSTIDKLYIGKNGYLIVMPNTTIKFPKNSKIIIEGTLSVLNGSKLYIENRDGIILNSGNIKIRNSYIEAKKFAFMLKGESIANVYRSKIISRFAAFNINNASYLEAKDSIFDTSKSANASLLISGNSYVDIKNCKFSHKPLFDIISNSTKKSNIFGSKDLKILGDINVIKK